MVLEEKFDIQGMTCSSCSTHVEKAIKNLNGVFSVYVNLLTNSMVVVFNEKEITVKDIIKAVIDAGYNASVFSEKKKINKNNDIKYMKKRVIMSFVFLIPLMFIAMHKMFFNILNIDIPTFLLKIFYGDNVIIFTLIQLILLIPIIYINRNYFKTGIKRLLKKTIWNEFPKDRISMNIRWGKTV